MFEDRDRELEMVFVELPKFTKNLEALTSLTDKWIYFLKEAPSLDVIPTTLRDIQEIAKALNIANQANLTVEELEKLDKREVFFEDWCGSIIKAKQEGKLEECLALVLRLVDRKFPDIPAATLTEIKTLSLARLEELLTVAMLDFNSLTDLSGWLQDNAASD